MPATAFPGVVRDTHAETFVQSSAKRIGPKVRILVIRRRYLGDIVLLGSVLRNLRLHWPVAHITVLTERAYAGVLALNPDVDAALSFPQRAAGWLSFVNVLRRAQCTHVLDFDNTEKTALVARLTGASVRATFDRELIPFRYGRLYTHVARVSNAFYDSHHITETYLALPAAIGVPLASRDVRLVPRPEDSAAIAPLMGPQSKAQNSRRKTARVLVHPGSRSPFRLWPVERFAAVCDHLQDLLDVQVFLTAGPSERHLVEGVRSKAKTHLAVLRFDQQVGLLAAALPQFDLFFCHDSGPMHVAAAVGTPVVALFGSQNATIWRPLGPRHAVLQTRLPCACVAPATTVPCVRDDSYRSFCVRMLTEEQVFAAIARQLRKNA